MQQNNAYKQIENWQRLPELAPLLDTPSPPKKLFAIGKWDATLFDHCVAIVGSRRMTEYGRQVIEKIVPQLVFEKKTIISGFMYGVDQYAHQICLENGGRTIAVLGWGISLPLTNEDQKLADKIIRTGGLLLSEWENRKPALWTFPARNRVVVGISKEVIIIEATQKSGSLITAKLANKLKRKLYAVPGPITTKTSEGTNNLIATGKAQMWLGEQTINEIYSADPIVELLKNEPLNPSEISRILQLPISQIGAKVSMLTLTGQIVERSGKYYAC